MMQTAAWEWLVYTVRFPLLQIWAFIRRQYWWVFIEIQKVEVYNYVYLFNYEKTDRFIHKIWKISKKYKVKRWGTIILDALFLTEHHVWTCIHSFTHEWNSFMFSFCDQHIKWWASPMHTFWLCFYFFIVWDHFGGSSCLQTILQGCNSLMDASWVRLWLEWAELPGANRTSLTRQDESILLVLKGAVLR